MEDNVRLLVVLYVHLIYCSFASELILKSHKFDYNYVTSSSAKNTGMDTEKYCNILVGFRC